MFSYNVANVAFKRVSTKKGLHARSLSFVFVRSRTLLTSPKIPRFRPHERVAAAVEVHTVDEELPPVAPEHQEIEHLFLPSSFFLYARIRYE